MKLTRTAAIAAIGQEVVATMPGERHWPSSWLLSYLNVLCCTVHRYVLNNHTLFLGAMMQYKMVM